MKERNDMKVIARIIAIIFDLDGLLLMTEGIYDLMFRTYGRLRSGHDISDEAFNAMRARQFGAGTEQSARVMLEAYGLPVTEEEVQKYLDWRQSYDLEEKFIATQAFPGAQDLIIKLHEHNFPLALATSSSHTLLEAKATNHPWLLTAFDSNIITGDDVSNKKPHPESFQAAAKLLGISTNQHNQVLVLEDAPNGVQAAKAAGMKVVAIPDPRLSNKEKELAGADQILNSFEEFNPQQWGMDI